MPTITINLAEEKLERLQEAANAQGKSLDQLVEEAVDAYLREHDKPAARSRFEGVSVAEALKDYIGAGGDGPPTDSSRMSEVFVEILEQKHREGHF